jgi:hypothetical protein
MEDTLVGSKMKKGNDPAKVAAQGFQALINGKQRVFSESILTKLQSYALKILPTKAKAEVHRKMSAPGSAHH